MLSEKSFALLCFLVLADHHGQGYVECAPGMLEEKAHILNAGYEAFAHLDYPNMTKVMQYLRAWNVMPPPEVANEFEMQTEAYLKLKQMGIDLG